MAGRWGKKVIALAALVVLAAAALALWPKESSPRAGLVYRIESFAISLDPGVIGDTVSQRIMGMIHAKLVRSIPDDRFAGEIAHSWQWISPTTLRLELKPDQTFSDGRQVTAADAAWSLCRLVQPGSVYAWLFKNVSHVPGQDGRPTECPGLRATAPLTLEIEVTEDPTRLLPALATIAASIVPAHATPGAYGQMPGAGPYVVEQIVPNARLVLRGRSGGPMEPGAEQATFQLVQDDATAVNLFRTGRLDVLEISNPTLYRLLVDADGRLSVPGRLVSSDVHQIRVLIFNRAAIARTLGVTEGEAAEWVRAFKASIDVDAIARRFDPLLIALTTSYFPARGTVQRPRSAISTPAARGRLSIITQNDPFSDAIAAMLAHPVGGVDLSYAGLEKSVMVSRLVNRQYDIISLPIEAIVAGTPSYWLSFFMPGSSFTLFGEAIEGLDASHDAGAARRNAELIDRSGNWFVLAQERRFVALQPRVVGETFFATGMINYATIGVAP